MNEKRIAIGLAAWFLGIIVPVYHHAARHAAIGQQPTNNVITRIQSVFEWLPWIDWVYLAGMWLMALVLVISGLTPPTARRADDARRGFEVVRTSERDDGGR